uniref:Uncharacterized protein n=1 Tax=Glossina palpalis gambiensis TaxID=67801 RepID=A0A1B0BBK8_9MUSC
MPLMLATLDQQELSISSSFIGNEVASTTANVITSGSKSPSSPSPTKSMSVATNHHYYNYMPVTTNAQPIAVANFKINNHNNNNNEQVAANAFTTSTNALTPQINNFGNKQPQQQVSNAKSSFFNPAFSIDNKPSLFYAHNSENMAGAEGDEKERQIAVNTRYMDNYRSWNNKDFFANTKNWNIHDRMTDSQNTAEMRIKKEQVKEEEEIVQSQEEIAQSQEESVAADISEKNATKAELINAVTTIISKWPYPPRRPQQSEPSAPPIRANAKYYRFCGGIPFKPSNATGSSRM